MNADPDLAAYDAILVTSSIPSPPSPTTQEEPRMPRVLKRQRITLSIVSNEVGAVVERLTQAAGDAWSSASLDAVRTTSDGEARARKITPRDDEEVAAITTALLMYEEEMRNDDESRGKVIAVGRVLDRLQVKR